MLRRVAVLIGPAIQHNWFLGEASRHHLETGESMWRAKLALFCGARLAVGDVGALAISTAGELVHEGATSSDAVQGPAHARRRSESVGTHYTAQAVIRVGGRPLTHAYRVLVDAPDEAVLVRPFAGRACGVAGGQAEGVSPMLWLTVTPTLSLLSVKAAAVWVGLSVMDIATARKFGRSKSVASQPRNGVADVTADDELGALNGAAVLAVDSAGPQNADFMRQALTHAMQQSVAVHDQAALIAPLQPAAEVARLWRDRLLTAAMQQLVARPLRQVLSAAAAAIASLNGASPQVSHHAA